MVMPKDAVANSAADVVRADLDGLCAVLQDEFERMAGGRLLITGGAGFLGHYLVQAPLRWNRLPSCTAPIDVTVYDSFIRGVPPWLAGLEADPHLQVERYDVRDPLPTDPGDYDYLVHAASIASPTYYRQRPIETMDANVNGLRNLLEYARERRDGPRPVKGFLFYSTSEIYGDPGPADIPTPETYRGNVSCVGPRACYDESKRYGETLSVNFARSFDLPVTIARPFNNYGPGLKITDRRVIPDFARNIFRGEDIVLLSDGSPTRTYCYVADAVAGYFKILTRGRPGEAYNIGTDGPEISIAELAELMVAAARELFGYRGRVVRRQSSDPDYLTDNPHRRCPVIAKARNDLGYEPSVALREGLARTLIWYREHQTAEEG
jgi:UDP-glucuronate decarboxylase